MKKIEECMSQACKAVLSRLEKAGLEAYITGKTVRDLLLYGKCYAHLILTNGTPEQIGRLFGRCIASGHGAVTVIENKTAFEMLPFRRLLNQEENRQRWDFTVNAIGYSLSYGWLDPFGGLEDLKNGIVRSTGRDGVSFEENPIRMLRAVSLAAEMDFAIEERTAQMIKENAQRIKKADKKAVFEECHKILMSKKPQNFRLLHEYGLLEYIMPSLEICFSTPQKNKYHIFNVGEHIMNAVGHTGADPVIRWAVLFHDIGKPRCMSKDASGIIHFYGHHKESVAAVEEIFRTYRYFGEWEADILALVEYHDVRIDTSVHAVKKMMSRMGEQLFLKLLEVQEADNRAKNPKYIEERLARIRSAREIFERIKAEGQPYRISDLAVSGRDLIKLKYHSGRQINDTLRRLLDEVMIDPALNQREYLLRRARELRVRGINAD